MSKICCSCREPKALSEFYKDARQADGLYLRCKGCHAKSTAKWSQNNRAVVALAARRRRAANLEHHREIQRRSAKKTYPRHAERLKKRSKAWYAANRERASEYHRNYRAEHAEKKSAYAAAYYAEHGESIRARVKVSGPIWAAANPDKRRAIQKRRQAAQLRAVPSWANEEVIGEIYAKCVEVERATGIPHHVDHIVPLQGKTVCGLHVENNLQILPGKENQSKSNRVWPDMPAPLRQAA